MLCDTSPNGIPVGLPWLWSGLWPGSTYSLATQWQREATVFGQARQVRAHLSQSGNARWSHDVVKGNVYSEALLANAHMTQKHEKTEHTQRLH